jgi:hypothetical protein
VVGEVEHVASREANGEKRRDVIVVTAGQAYHLIDALWRAAA